VNTDPDRSNRPRLVVAAVASLVVIGAILGGFVGLLGSAIVTVLPDADPTPRTSGGEPETYEPLTPQTPTQEPLTTPTQEPSETATTRSPRPPKPRPTLTATPLQAGTYERIDLTGAFPGLPEGVQLQVQRKEDGAWVAFPVAPTTQPGGVFSTSIETGRPGANFFRITDPASGRSTPPVTVQIG